MNEKKKKGIHTKSLNKETLKEIIQYVGKDWTAVKELGWEFVEYNKETGYVVMSRNGYVNEFWEE